VRHRPQNRNSTFRKFEFASSLQRTSAALGFFVDQLEDTYQYREDEIGVVTNARAARLDSNSELAFDLAFPDVPLVLQSPVPQDELFGMPIVD